MKGITMSKIGHNKPSAEDNIRAFVERIERLDEEAQALNADRKDVYGEAKASGFDAKVLRKIIADRRTDPSTREEFNAVYRLYAEALGMLPEDAEKPNDFYTRAPAREEMPDPAIPEPTREPAPEAEPVEVVHDPETGEIIERPAYPPEVDEGQPRPSSPADDDMPSPVNAVAGNIIRTAEGEQESGEIVSDEPAQPGADDSPSLDERVAAAKRLRPDCLHPGEEMCGGYGTHLCGTCKVAKEKPTLPEAPPPPPDDFETPAFLRREGRD